MRDIIQSFDLKKNTALKRRDAPFPLYLYLRRRICIRNEQTLRESLSSKPNNK